MAREVEDELSSLSSSGHTVTKLSIVGYSLGGLIARYCIGLLYSRGWFEPGKLQPTNFTAFASPFLGVRTPLKGYTSSFWNSLGGNMLSASGQQLFLLDTFRDTGRPLLSVLAEPNSIFIKALSCFKHRVLYANIINDRSAPYYTTGISATDPYEDLSLVDLHPVSEPYSPTILSPERPVSRKPSKHENSTVWGYLGSTIPPLFQQLPFYALITLLTPIAASAFLLNSGFQTVRSMQRVKLHNDDSSPLGLGFRSYRIPLMVDGAVESMQTRGPQEHLDSTSTNLAQANGHVKPQQQEPSNEKLTLAFPSGAQLGEGKQQSEDFPTLALAPEQFAMIRHLDAVGWRKYPVHITKVRHSHAAIIVRTERESFSEGLTVLRHWVEEEFEV